VYNHSTNCTFITAGAFIPNGIWATTYDGSYLFADGGCGKIFLRSGNGAVDYTSPFAQTSGVISDMAFLTQEGQTALYYVTNEAGELHKITLPAPVPTPPAPGTASTVAIGTQAPVTAAATRCRIVDVRELLASTARVRIAASHCKPHEIVVAMRDGRAVRRHHELVRAALTAKPKRPAGRRRVWTLRVESIMQKPGRTYSAGTTETVWVGWEATPKAIAEEPGGRYV
jgi:hypothetical protein